MANWIAVAGVKPYDGRYELDLDGQPLTTREWGWIKRNCGYLPVELTAESFTDPELITMLAIVAMRRAGRVDTGQVPELWDRFSDVPVGAAITMGQDDDADVEGDAGPPARKNDAKQSTSGPSSPNGSETSEGPRSRTGSPASATSESAPATSAR